MAEENKPKEARITEEQYNQLQTNIDSMREATLKGVEALSKGNYNAFDKSQKEFQAAAIDNLALAKEVYTEHGMTAKEREELGRLMGAIDNMEKMGVKLTPELQQIKKGLQEIQAIETPDRTGPIRGPEGQALERAPSAAQQQRVNELADGQAAPEKAGASAAKAEGIVKDDSKVFDVTKIKGFENLDKDTQAKLTALGDQINTMFGKKDGKGEAKKAEAKGNAQDGQDKDMLALMIQMIQLMLTSLSGEKAKELEQDKARGTSAAVEGAVAGVAAGAAGEKPLTEKDYEAALKDLVKRGKDGAFSKPDLEASKQDLEIIKKHLASKGDQLTEEEKRFKEFAKLANDETKDLGERGKAAMSLVKEANEKQLDQMLAELTKTMEGGLNPGEATKLIKDGKLLEALETKGEKNLSEAEKAVYKLLKDNGMDVSTTELTPKLNALLEEHAEKRYGRAMDAVNQALADNSLTLKELNELQKNKDLEFLEKHLEEKAKKNPLTAAETQLLENVKAIRSGEIAEVDSSTGEKKTRELDVGEYKAKFEQMQTDIGAIQNDRATNKAVSETVPDLGSERPEEGRPVPIPRDMDIPNMVGVGVTGVTGNPALGGIAANVATVVQGPVEAAQNMIAEGMAGAATVVAAAPSVASRLAENISTIGSQARDAVADIPLVGGFLGGLVDNVAKNASTLLGGGNAPPPPTPDAPAPTPPIATPDAPVPATGTPATAASAAGAATPNPGSGGVAAATTAIDAPAPARTSDQATPLSAARDAVVTAAVEYESARQGQFVNDNDAQVRKLVEAARAQGNTPDQLSNFAKGLREDAQVLLQRREALQDRYSEEDIQDKIQELSQVQRHSDGRRVAVSLREPLIAQKLAEPGIPDAADVSAAPKGPAQPARPPAPDPYREAHRDLEIAARALTAAEMGIAEPNSMPADKLDTFKKRVEEKLTESQRETNRQRNPGEGDDTRLDTQHLQSETSRMNKAADALNQARADLTRDAEAYIKERDNTSTLSPEQRREAGHMATERLDGARQAGDPGSKEFKETADAARADFNEYRREAAEVNKGRAELNTARADLTRDAEAYIRERDNTRGELSDAQSRAAAHMATERLDGALQAGDPVRGDADSKKAFRENIDDARADFNQMREQAAKLNEERAKALDALRKNAERYADVFAKVENIPDRQAFVDDAVAKAEKSDTAKIIERSKEFEEKAKAAEGNKNVSDAKEQEIQKTNERAAAGFNSAIEEAKAGKIVDATKTVIKTIKVAGIGEIKEDSEKALKQIREDFKDLVKKGAISDNVVNFKTAPEGVATGPKVKGSNAIDGP